MEGNRERSRTMDFAKGIVILLIVTTHFVFLREVAGGTETNMTNPIMQAIYTGLMLFLIVSGYFYNPGRSFAENVRHRLPKLIIQFAIALTVLPAILFLYQAALGQNPDPSGFVVCFKALFLGRVSSLEPQGTTGFIHPTFGCFLGSYYIFMMIVAFPMFYFLASKVHGDIRKTATQIAVMLVAACALKELSPVVPPFCLIQALVACAFMLLGMELGRHRIVEWMEEDGLRDRRFWISFLASFVCGLALIIVLNPGTGFDDDSFGNYGGFSVFPYFLEQSLMCYSFLCILSLLQRIRPLQALFSTLGKHTLGILLYHCFFAKLVLLPFFTMPKYAWWPADMSTLIQIAMTLFTLAVCTVLAANQEKILGALIGKLRKGGGPRPAR